VRPVTTYRELLAPLTLRRRARLELYGRIARRIAFGGRGDGIRFLYYHHVFDDEIAGFERQLDRLARRGPFLSLDEAVDRLASGSPIRGRAWCVTFDDGFRNQLANAVPALAARGISAAFFVPVDFVGAPPERSAGLGATGYPPVEFLTWDECRRMAAAGMTIGSHGVAHVDLGRLDDAAAEVEIAESRRRIESALGRPCRHFSAPWGRPENYRPDRDPALARRHGYASFLTTLRGTMRAGSSPYEIRRLHAIAAWDA
jgi:peptidoglycan/xylan/chitin deacetylase (PgdA/CDA1 family)